MPQLRKRVIIVDFPKYHFFVINVEIIKYLMQEQDPIVWHIVVTWETIFGRNSSNLTSFRSTLEDLR
jgi:hypothetical protein